MKRPLPNDQHCLKDNCIAVPRKYLSAHLKTIATLLYFWLPGEGLKGLTNNEQISINADDLELKESTR